MENEKLEQRLNDLDLALEEIRGAALFTDDEDVEGNKCIGYVELPIITNANIDKAKKILQNLNFEVTCELECEGSDYAAYCIWFKQQEESLKATIARESQKDI